MIICSAGTVVHSVCLYSRDERVEMLTLIGAVREQTMILVYHVTDLIVFISVTDSAAVFGMLLKSDPPLISCGVSAVIVSSN